MSSVVPIAVIDESNRRLKVKVAQLNARLPGPDRILSTRRETFFLALHPRAPLDINQLRTRYPQECQALRIQGTATVRDEACDRCKRMGESLKFLFPTCRSLSNLASGACANCVYIHKPNECSLHAGMCMSRLVVFSVVLLTSSRLSA